MTEPTPTPSTPPPGGRSRNWGRVIATVATPIAILLIAIRLRAILASTASAYDQGRMLGELVGGPLVIGAVIWGAIALWSRWRGRSTPFLAAGLVAAIALAGIYAAFANVSASVPDLAKTGQAHACYLNVGGKIVGCVMKDGSTIGETTSSTATCYFDEPLPTGDKPITCSH